jgi:hypothetical protein
MVGRRLRRAIEQHLGSRDVARVIYGTVIGLALVVALEAHPPSAGETVAAVLATAVAVGLAELYSELVATEMRLRRALRAPQIREAAADTAAVMFGAGFPALFFLLAAAGTMEVATAFTLAKWTGLGLLCAYGLLAGRLAGASWPRALMHAAAVGAVGGFVIGLKALVH